MYYTYIYIYIYVCQYLFIAKIKIYNEINY